MTNWKITFTEIFLSWGHCKIYQNLSCKKIDFITIFVFMFLKAHKQLAVWKMYGCILLQQVTLDMTQIIICYLISFCLWALVWLLWMNVWWGTCLKNKAISSQLKACGLRSLFHHSLTLVLEKFLLRNNTVDTNSTEDAATTDICSLSTSALRIL